MRPLIGITGPSSFSTDMMQMVEKLLGANYVLLYQDSTENLNDWVEKLQGVIFAGGADIHPSVYGSSVTSYNNLSKFDIRRDVRELRLLSACMDRKVPVLGVCRGHQMIGIFNGIELIQDISSSGVSHFPNKSGITLSKDEPAHMVKLVDAAAYHEEYRPGTAADTDVLELVRGKDKDNGRIWVNSFHHQGLWYKKPHKDAAPPVPPYRILGLGKVGLEFGKEKCEFIIELMDGPGWLSAQWHPEHDWEVNPHSRAVLNKFGEMVAAK